MLIEMLKLVYFLLPVYIADMAPLFFRGTLCSLDKPLDFGLKFKGKDLLGKNKTFRGAIVGVVLGMIVFNLQQALKINSIIIYADYRILLGFLLGLGTILGDLFKSFIKRRLNIKPGKSFYIADQIDSILGALVLSSFIIDYTWFQIGFMLLVSLMLKILANHLGFYLHIRYQKW